MPRANRWSPSARVYAFDPLSFTTDRWKCTVDAYTIGKARGALYVALGQVRYFDAHAQVEGMTYEQVVPYIRTVFGLNTRAKWDGSRLWVSPNHPMPESARPALVSTLDELLRVSSDGAVAPGWDGWYDIRE